MKPRNTVSAGGKLLLAVLLSACGELTSGGVGEVEVWATADDPENAPMASSPAPSYAAGPGATPGADPAPAQARALGAMADGQLTALLRVYLQAEPTGEWLEITDGPRDVTLDLSGASERRVGVRFLASGRYTGFRVVFERVEVNVTGGLTVGGVPVIGTVRVDLGAGATVTVERDLVLEVENRSAQDVVLDLGADIWLPQLSLATRTVAAAHLQSAVAIRVR